MYSQSVEQDHENRTTDRARLDGSLPPHQATDILAHCTPRYDGDIHLIQMLPHMHARGTRLTTVVERASNARETLIDVPFDFNNQIHHATDMVLKPGDRLTTTCHFQNDTDRVISYGTATENEMCGITLTAWPAGSLNTGTNSKGGLSCSE